MSRLRDLALMQQILLEQLKSGQVQSFNPALAELKRLYKNLILEYENGDLFSDIPKKELNKLLVQMEGIHTEVFKKPLADYMGELPELAGTVAKMEASAIATASLVDIAKFNIPADAKLYKAAFEKPIFGAGKFMDEFIEGWAKKDVEHIQDAVRAGWAQGKPLMSMVREVESQIAGKTTSDLTAVIHTATQNVATSARFSTYEANPKIVKKFRWLSTLDRHTCPKCQPLDLTIHPITFEPKPGKVHIRCRCSSEPVFDPIYDFGGTRASANGQVDKNESYYSWIKKQPVEDQEIAMGVKRSKLLRDGGLTIKRFQELNMDRDFEPVTLKELKQKAPAAFKKAGL